MVGFDAAATWYAVRDGGIGRAFSRFLIVDDDPDMRAVIAEPLREGRSFLRSAGTRVSASAWRLRDPSLHGIVVGVDAVHLDHVLAAVGSPIGLEATGLEGGPHQGNL